MHAVPVHPIAAAVVTAAAAQVPPMAAIAITTNGHAYGSLYEACVAMRDKVDAFLAEEATAPLLRRAQERVRISVQVVEEALERYR